MDDVCGVPVRVGTISQLEQATTEAVAAPGEEARTFVHAQKVAHRDVTRWRQGSQRAWLWVAVTRGVPGGWCGGHAVLMERGRCWGRHVPASWGRIATVPPTGIRCGGVRCAGPICDAIVKRCVVVVVVPRRLVMPCWPRHTRGFSGGIGCVMGHCNGRAFGPR